MSYSQQPGSPPAALDNPTSLPEPAVGRPIGVTLIAILFVFYAVVVGFNAFFAVQALSLPSLSATARSDARMDLILSLAQLPFYALIAFGLWRLREWGRYLALVFLGLNLARFVVEAFWLPTLAYALLATLSRSVIPLAMILYLLHASIRPLFRPKSARKA